MAGRVTSPVFVGRRAELALLEAAVERAAAGEPSLILVDGEAGIGKSRLIAELVAGVRAGADRDGPVPGVGTDTGAGSDEPPALVLAGGCVPLGESGLPFAPIVEALRSLAAQVPPHELQAALGPAAVDLARLVPELSDRPEPEAALYEPGEWLQARLFEGFRGLLGRLGDMSPVVLVIEDLHWADQSTRDLVAFLARSLRTERLTIVATIRIDDLGAGHPLLAWLAEVERLPTVERMALTGFDRTEILTQLEAILGVPQSPALVESVLGRSDGNPFYAEEIVAAGGERAGERLPTTLREVVLVRVARLSPTGRSVLDAVSAAGRRIDPDLLAEVVGMSEPELEAALREGIGVQLIVVEQGPGAERYAFRHALVQETIYAELLPTQRRRLHVALAEALERRGPTPEDGGVGLMAELAHHWEAGADRPRALVASLAAARGAAAEYAFAEAARHYERTIELWDAVPDAEHLVGTDLPAILSDAAGVLGNAGHPARGLALAQAAVDRFDGAADPERAALLEERLAWAATEYGEIGLATEVLGAAVERLRSAPPSRAQAMVQTSYARNLYVRDIDGAIPAAELAIATARVAGVPNAEADALITLGGALRDVGEPDRAIAYLEEAVAIAEAIGDVWELGRAYDHLSGAIRETGAVERAMEVTLASFERARQLGVGPSFGMKPMLEHAWALIGIGRWDEARSYLDTAAAMAPEGIIRLLYCTTAGWLEALRGEFASARRLLDEGRVIRAALHDPRWATWLHVICAQLELLDGTLEAARREIDEGLGGEPRYQEVLFSCRVGMEIEADIAERGRARRRPAEVAEARVRADDFLARCQESVAHVPDPASPTRRWLIADLTMAEAELSRLEGRSDPEAWAVAAERWAAVQLLYEATYARYREGEALLAEGHRRIEAESVLREAGAAATRLGARPLRERIEALARRGRIELGAVGEGRAVPSPAAGDGSDAGDPSAVADGAPLHETPSDDPYALTVREREVLVLLAQGRTNRQIGEALFISSSTAGVHVSNILAKLGVTSRTEAAAVAVRLGLAS